MRIGELAELAGVTPRTVRHYHHIGLLPEPERAANGYRVYGLLDLSRVVRVRRLTALGLSLDEVRDVLADASGGELREVLAELDGELARQEIALRLRRARVAELLAEADQHAGLPAEGPVSPELAALFRRMKAASGERPGPEPAAAGRERELLALLDGVAPAPDQEWLAGLARSFGSDPEAMRLAYEIYARIDALAEAPADDPRVEPLARTIAEGLPEEIARLATEGAGPDPWDGGGARAGSPVGPLAEAFFASYGPAQVEVIRRAMALLAERQR
ncbi:MerR family transcriptional regulator [Streptomyces profundus]|uniref:MerR family transcriptional regulator n=1 Tax=Streptomyces profundus TaxID=2867410 RepID=UPI001D16750E|nr:MerR family transcriptional regulator [Streptomyces sp. MA3_2.13]UED85365.1 MerR family transcriptional regulator [Streptomyces sp. MA3_2.13]